MDGDRGLVDQQLKHLSQKGIDGLWNGGNVEIGDLMINEDNNIHVGRGPGVE